MFGMKVPFLLLCGPRGVGKSSVAFQVFLEVMGSGIKAGYVDLGQVSFCRPVPQDDPDNHRVKVRNLARIWSVYQQAGARCLIAAGEIGPDVVDAYAAAAPELHLSVCYLDAAADTIRDRLFARGRGEGPPIPGDELRGNGVASLTRLAEEAAHAAEDPKRLSIGHVRVVTDDQTVAQVAARIRAELGGWPQTFVETHS
jgi:hypothetical protein